MNYGLKSIKGSFSCSTDEALQFNGSNREELARFNANEHIDAGSILSMQDMAREGCYLAYVYDAINGTGGWSNVALNGWVVKGVEIKNIVGISDSKFKKELSNMMDLVIRELESLQK